MDTKPPTLEQWRGLYDLAAQVKKMAPWDWMAEDQVFGVHDPVGGELIFVSVMGMMGEHYAVGVYLGAGALYQFWELEDNDEDLPVEQLLEIPQLQLSFEDREELEEEDRKQIKQLGLQYRGRGEWPMFRSIRPGYLPWFLEDDEVRLLTLALEQLLDVAPRVEEDPDILNPDDDNEDVYLVREQDAEGGSTAWHDKALEIQPPEGEAIEVAVDGALLEAASRLPRRKGAVEIDVFMFPAPMQEGRERPRFPYLLLVVDAQNGLALASELLIPEPNLQAMWGEIPSRTLGVFMQAKQRPSEIRVAAELLEDLLGPVAQEIGAKFKLVEELPALDNAREGLMQGLLEEHDHDHDDHAHEHGHNHKH